jgi:hypothetical protein
VSALARFGKWWITPPPAETRGREIEWNDDDGPVVSVLKHLSEIAMHGLLLLAVAFFFWPILIPAGIVWCIIWVAKRIDSRLTSSR